METLTLEYVHKYKTKPQSRGWKCVCPGCGGNDLWYTDDNGSAFCFECGVNYKVTDEEHSYEAKDDGRVVFDVQRIRELYHSAHDFYTHSLTRDHKAYLHDRGMDDTAIETFKVGYCPTNRMPFYFEPIAKDAGLLDYKGDPALVNRVVFPYMAEDSITDLRGRVIETEVPAPKYRGLRHRSISRGAIYPFNYARAMEFARDQKIVILTEGEIKAIIADMHGFPCVALPGMLAWKPGFIVRPDVKVIIAFDSNRLVEDRARVDKAIQRVSRRLLNSYVTVLPLLGESKMDIDSFLLHSQGGYSRFKHLIDNAVPYEMYLRLRRF
jgi:hypothetical protein